MFAAIYHPVGIADAGRRAEKMGRALGWNGLWGNLGLAAAALISGALMDWFGWRAAFFVPGGAVDRHRRCLPSCSCPIPVRCRSGRRPSA